MDIHNIKYEKKKWKMYDKYLFIKYICLYFFQKLKINPGLLLSKTISNPKSAKKVLFSFNCSPKVRE